VLAAFRWTAPLVVSSQEEDEAVTVSVAKDADHELTITQPKLEQAASKLAAEARSANADSLLLQDLSYRCADRPSVDR
jgi:hypothetical protein